MFSNYNIKMITSYIVIAVLTGVQFQGCNLAHRSENAGFFSQGFIKTEDTRFVDSFGREILLHGINLVNKNPEVNYLGTENQEDFKIFKHWGFNCIRLGIIWDGLEPEPGKYNEEYLQGIDQRLQWAKDNQIYVVLDMHQDLYSVKYSDGAPEWATIDEHKPHLTGDLWSDSYLISPAVQTAFDNFWVNTPAPDGVGIQDHYIAAWKHVAERYADNPTVIGYDIMNEPFMGSGANDIMPVLLTAYAQVFSETTGKEPPGEEELLEIWSKEDSRLEALKNIAEADKYKRVIDAIYGINAPFESTVLSGFYQKVRNEIRKVDKNHILFLEHGYFNNAGVYSAIRPVLDENGNPDPLQAYAAHGYDLLTDTKEVERPSYERVELVFNRIGETSVRLNMPVLLGEWGAFHSKSDKMVETADHAIGMIEKLKFSNTYWAYYKDIDQYPYFNQSIVRPYPCEISGNLESYMYDRDSGIFECVWFEDTQISSPTKIYLPDLRQVSDENILMEPESDQIILESFSSSNSGFLMVSPTGNSQMRKLRIRFEVADINNLRLE